MPAEPGGMDDTIAVPRNRRRRFARLAPEPGARELSLLSNKLEVFHGPLSSEAAEAPTSVFLVFGATSRSLRYSIVVVVAVVGGVLALKNVEISLPSTSISTSICPYRSNI